MAEIPDNASPDRCGTLLDAYAEKHGDLEVVHLRENVGFGQVHEGGRRKADASSHLPAGSPTIDRVLGVQHPAWNRIVKRDFLYRNERTPPVPPEVAPAPHRAQTASIL